MSKAVAPRNAVNVDPTTFAVLRRSLAGVVNEMGATLAKAQFLASGAIRAGRTWRCAPRSSSAWSSPS